MHEPTVQLWANDGLGLIVEYPSGIVYSNQTGGVACYHPELEGVYVPLRSAVAHSDPTSSDPQRTLQDLFMGPKYMGSGARRGIDADDADLIDDVLAGLELDELVYVDRSRLSESHEAWVWVVVSGDEGDAGLGMFHGFDPYPRSGVLTWQNSD